jgi:hypothetical protein
MSYIDVRRKLDEQKGEPPPVRDHRCVAHGCPNAGSVINAKEEPGRCYWHWKAPAQDWPAVTEWIKADFDKRRNF